MEWNSDEVRNNYSSWCLPSFSHKSEKHTGSDTRTLHLKWAVSQYLSNSAAFNAWIARDFFFPRHDGLNCSWQCQRSKGEGEAWNDQGRRIRAAGRSLGDKRNWWDDSKMSCNLSPPRTLWFYTYTQNIFQGLRLFSPFWRSILSFSLGWSTAMFYYSWHQSRQVDKSENFDLGSMKRRV